MTQETHIEESENRDGRNHELARGILGVGLLAAVLYGALTLLRRRKAILLRPTMVLVFIILALALLGTLLKALRSRRFHRS